MLAPVTGVGGWSKNCLCRPETAAGLPCPPARLVSLWGQRRRQPPPPGHLVSRPGAVLLVSTVEGVLTIPCVLEADELELASLATGGLLVLVVAMLATLLVGGLLPGRHGGHELTTLVVRLHLLCWAKNSLTLSFPAPQYHYSN